MQIDNQTRIKRGTAFSTKEITIVALMMALTVTMCLTPIGMIVLPMVRFTIAHMPILITAILFGLNQGLMVSLAFGTTSLLIALTQPISILDPFFVNPLVSVVPRLLIPVTTYLAYKAINKFIGKTKKGHVAAVAISVAVGNITNTIGVCSMLYFVYAKQIFEKTGVPALEVVLGLVTTATLIECTAVVILTTPIIIAVEKALKKI